MKHILIDGTTISHQMDGLTQYILNVVLRLDVANYSYTLLLRPNEYPERYLPLLQAKNIRIEEADIAPIGPLRDVQFAFYLRKNREFDAVLVPSNQYPLALRLPAVYVIHDLIYEQFPEQLGRLGWLKRCYLRFVVRTGLRRAQTIVAVSKYTKSEIVRCYGKRFQDKIQVIYEGWEHLNNDQNNESARVDIPFEEYILYVGSSRGHKNLSRLVSAMQLYKHKLPENMGLVIVGNQKMFSSDQLRAIEEANTHRKLITLTGWLSDEKLNYCFGAAKAVIFPSLCEGFGIPVLEAFFHKKPLLLSNRSSLPEVAGEAAIYFDPTDIKDIADKILQVAKKEDFTDLVEKQNKQLTKYSWHTTANQITNIFQSIWHIK